jgi:hypothetical protein
MSDEYKIELTEEAKALLAGVQKLPAEIPSAIARALDRENQLTVAHIQKAYLSFPKSGPVSEIGLRVQSNRLRAAAAAFPAVVSGTRVESAIGDSVKYAALHEFGGTVHHPARKGKVRLRETAQGELM